MPGSQGIITRAGYLEGDRGPRNRGVVKAEPTSRGSAREHRAPRPALIYEVLIGRNITPANCAA